MFNKVQLLATLSREATLSLACLYKIIVLDILMSMSMLVLGMDWTLKFYVKEFYVMGKVLSDKLS